MSYLENDESVFREEVYREMKEDRDKDPLSILDEICSILKIKKESLVEGKIKNLRLKIQELEILLENYQGE